MYTVERNWITPAGLRAIVIAGENHRCGYVGVGQPHPLFGVAYHEQSPEITNLMASTRPIGAKGVMLAFTAGVGADEVGRVRRSPDVMFDCHGGLTYSGGLGHYPTSDPLWWFGFDCAHLGDGRWGRMEEYSEGPIRSQAYVEAECESLARQLVEFADAYRDGVYPE